MAATATINGRYSPPCGETGCVERLETLYIHLLNGDVEVVTEVSGVEVTDDAIVFRRNGHMPVTYRRNAVYFTCCDRNQQPPQF
jgi:hypothetical protein